MKVSKVPEPAQALLHPRPAGVDATKRGQHGVTFLTTSPRSAHDVFEPLVDLPTFAEHPMQPPTRAPSGDPGTDLLNGMGDKRRINQNEPVDEASSASHGTQLRDGAAHV